MLGAIRSSGILMKTDTDWASLSIKPMLEPLAGPVFGGPVEVHAGAGQQVFRDVVVSDVYIPNNGNTVYINAIVDNQGHPKTTQDAKTAMRAADAALITLKVTNPYILVGTALAESVAGWLTTDCDGPVVAIRDSSFTGHDLWVKTGGYTPKTGYIILNAKGVDSPAGCGSNSDYTVVIQFTRRDAE